MVTKQRGMANGIVLSILIPTITGREAQYQKLHDKLAAQLFNNGIWNEVEIVSECDSREMSIGNKRQLLLNRSYGDFVVFIDDDDDIPEDYCLLFWQSIKDNPGIDCIGFLQSCVFDKGTPKSSCLSNRFEGWGQCKDGFDFVRTPFFPTPIKRDIAIQIGYKDLRWGEDYDFSVRLKGSGLIKKEHFINKVMYFYQYTYAPYEQKYGELKTK